MQPCELVLSISTLACAIAKDKSQEELAVLGAAFSQLGDSLAVIAAQQALCEQEAENCCKGNETDNKNTTKCQHTN